MSKGKIIFFDDDPAFSTQFESLMEDSGFEIVPFTTTADLKNAVGNEGLMRETKALIFDLANKKEENLRTSDFEILPEIIDKFNTYRIPIFIHSAFSDQIQEFDNCGTVWKVPKSGTSLEIISGKIDKLDNSGFLDAFTPGGLIEQSLMMELHRSFTEQFREGEIEKIIKTLEHEDERTYKERSIEVFKRVAVKSLMSELLAPIASDGKTVNAIEHYYRRISRVEFWTGDIFTRTDGTETLIILTPRCNVASKGVATLLVCNIEEDFPGSSKKDVIRRALTDNPNFSGSGYRYLPPTPIFKGGKINLSSHKTISKEILSAEYTRVITLSDDLTNEVLGKFASYFLRTGINTINVDELVVYLDNLKEGGDAEK